MAVDSRYLTFVTNTTKFAENKIIPLDDDDILLRFGKAMFRFEAGEDIPWKDKQIRYGLQLGRAGGEEKPKAKRRPTKAKGKQPKAKRRPTKAKR